MRIVRTPMCAKMISLNVTERNISAYARQATSTVACDAVSIPWFNMKYNNKRVNDYVNHDQTI